MAKRQSSESLAREMFEKLDAVRANNPGGTLPRATAIAVVAVFIEEKCMPKKKGVNYSNMTDEEFLEFLINTYSWLDIDRELKKCGAWVKVNIQNSTGPTRRRIINWMNNAGSKPMSAERRKSSNEPKLPIPEPESWREIILANVSENSIWYQHVRENTQWSSLDRATQLGIVQFLAARAAEKNA